LGCAISAELGRTSVGVTEKSFGEERRFRDVTVRCAGRGNDAL